MFRSKAEATVRVVRQVWYPKIHIIDRTLRQWSWNLSAVLKIWHRLLVQSPFRSDYGIRRGFCKTTEFLSLCEIICRPNEKDINIHVTDNII